MSPHVGWFTGWFALCAFFAGTASIAVAFATVFAAEVIESPTHGDIALIGAIAVVVGVAFNAAGIRRATLVNNIGATTELIGTLGIAAIVAVGLFFFKDKAGADILFDSTPVGDGSINLTVLGLAALLPVTSLLGWEGAADLAEETKEPRKTAPKAMLRAVAISGTGGFVIFAIFAMALPHGTVALLDQPENPLFYIFQEQFGSAFATVAKILVFILIVTQIAKRRGTLGAAPPGHFDLGRALNPFTVIGTIWCLVVIGYMTIPEVNHLAAEYSLGALALGFLQWVFILRSRIDRGEAGPPKTRADALLAAEHGDVSGPGPDGTDPLPRSTTGVS